jgi:hypothetical protein
MVIEVESPIPELLAKNPVLLAQAVNDLQLALIHPPGNGDQQKAEWVDNSLGLQSPLSRIRGEWWNHSGFPGGCPAAVLVLLDK